MLPSVWHKSAGVRGRGNVHVFPKHIHNGQIYFKCMRTRSCVRYLCFVRIHHVTNEDPSCHSLIKPETSSGRRVSVLPGLTGVIAAGGTKCLLSSSFLSSLPDNFFPCLSVQPARPATFKDLLSATGLSPKVSSSCWLSLSRRSQTFYNLNLS